MECLDCGRTIQKQGMGSHCQSCCGNAVGYNQPKELDLQDKDLTMDEVYTALLDAHTSGSHDPVNIQGMMDSFTCCLCES